MDALLSTNREMEERAGGRAEDQLAGLINSA
jgi:hypothetical protein